MKRVLHYAFANGVGKVETKVKICGITNKEDAELAAKYGADYLGVLVEVAISPRSKTLKEAKEIFASSLIPVVALVYKMSYTNIVELLKELRPYAIQFVAEGEDGTITMLKKEFPNLQIWQSLHLPAQELFDPYEIVKKAQSYLNIGVDIILLDTMLKLGDTKQLGGTGKTSNWELASQVIKQIQAPVMLAGGIKPDNVYDAVVLTKPFGVDVSSGVEIAKGKKDEVKINNLITAAKCT